ncbi:sigma-54-dependent Fis family transcriptional regulator [candidate division KSB1 bacterium]|nr:sigma-54-dependent Fis family transcriptional regulator [candidate division KSB1 bacterium]RQW01325.1 MAG: sigma-54-dependent Fis family transcriptional regulator [candidate division KSB1 bacterium]
MSRPKILIVDDNVKFIDDLSLLLGSSYECFSACTGEEGLANLAKKNYDLLLLDIDLGDGMDGFDVMDFLAEQEIKLPIIIVSHDHSIPTVVRALKKGAYDYIGKKPDLAEVRVILDRAMQEFGFKRDSEFYRDELRRQSGDLIGMSPAIQTIREQIAHIADTPTNVLITGESGTGKEIVAKQIHYSSQRRDKPFIPLNCAAIPKELFESELFGHERGAFTHAYKRRLGKFELADRGTIFLDEIAELDPSMQAKLLRVIQDKNIQRVGGDDFKNVNVRIIAATNHDLKVMVDGKQFREDFYYRLNVFPISIPPLRERREDIPLLVELFIKQKGEELKKNITSISQEALAGLLNYDWPGNVRELENMVERAVILAKGEQLLPVYFTELKCPKMSDPIDYHIAKKQAEENFQRDFIPRMIKLADGNISKAAEQMGITRQGLQKMLKNLGMDSD